ncbi:MAG: hypothetical protein QMD12_01680 [Candidatus Aenigmarchaeota archaeon]|nr:hypothetical protein [Candidatus Aenigmarchaeota archaeon]
MNENNLEELKNKFKKLIDEIYFTQNICEHFSRPGCSLLYCWKIQDLETLGREIFNSNFPLLIPPGSHEFNYFSALEDAKRNCITAAREARKCIKIYDKNCELSRHYFRGVKKYVKSLERSLGPLNSNNFLNHSNTKMKIYK